ncbi:hypothetical protein CU669_03280 [Paramagnetospirillum kuznetsovii]|uniref:Uncharacterized protein n=1 Tax=Paramagnetospirillum kuznetsovii TaxID=2053833 RepID=A0A364P259_9PROT|nr:hypothetical protein [Paramagnetospirillum kuznetsovii]RAU23195.1 hypothetical protein CU669_03280 [Paramagnetospirillum kuznetsovii]
MEGSLIAIIGNAITAARLVGLDRLEEREAARAVLLARDPSLTPGIARILVEQLYDSCSLHLESRLAV